ncbi:MAG: hypothetical protein SF069_07650 [Phycisphaerae bacterium]|nr:hypothetical protein [Phycisphaerae bacterium]
MNTPEASLVAAKGPHHGGHVVSADRRNRITSATMPSIALDLLQSAIRAVPWYRTVWTHPELRQRALRVLKRHAKEGFLIDASFGRVAESPAFGQRFEPIKLGDNDPQLRLLSGSEKTREEKRKIVAAWVAALLCTGVLGTIYYDAMLTGRGGRLGIILVGLLLFVGVTAAIGGVISAYRPKWYLVPGGVAVVRRPGGSKPPVTIFSRRNSIPVLRCVQIGKTTILACELWSESASESRRVSEREAISLKATWQSPRLPPSAESLSGLTGSG